MSQYFDFVINGDLRPDAPEAVIDLIRWLVTGSISDEAWARLEPYRQDNDTKDFFDYPFLKSNPTRFIVSNFQPVISLQPPDHRPVVHHYRLQFCGSSIHDDDWANYYIPIVYWLAAYMQDGFIGYSVETGYPPAILYPFIGANGRLQEKQRGPSAPPAT